MIEQFWIQNNLLNIIRFNNKKNKEILNEEKDSLVLKEKDSSYDKQRFLSYISIAKIFSSYGVIALHLNSNFWDFSHAKRKNWLISNFYQSLFCYPVPIFVLCIGATLLDFRERYGLFDYNKKRFVKVFIPLLGWTITLYYYKAYILKNISKIELDFSYIWNYFFLSKLFHIYNSLHIFILTYMLIPIVSFVEKKDKIKIYTYYFFLLLITQAIIPYLINLLGNKIIWIYKLNIGYLIYIFAGYIIHNHKFTRLISIIIYIFGISSFLLDLIGTHILALKYKKIKTLHKGYLNLPCIIYSSALFLFIKENSYFIFRFINKKTINKIGSLTLGPFFIHLALKQTIEKYITINNLIFFNLLFNSFLIFSMCIIFSMILRRIPLLNNLVP